MFNIHMVHWNLRFSTIVVNLMVQWSWPSSSASIVDEGEGSKIRCKRWRRHMMYCGSWGVVGSKLQCTFHNTTSEIGELTKLRTVFYEDDNDRVRLLERRSEAQPDRVWFRLKARWKLLVKHGVITSCKSKSQDYANALHPLCPYQVSVVWQ